MDKENDDELNKYANLEKVQQYQEQKLATRLDTIHKDLGNLNVLQQSNSDDLDALIAKATSLTQNIKERVSDEDVGEVKRLIKVTDNEKDDIIARTPYLEPIKTIKDSDEWSEFEGNLLSYAEEEKIDLTSDPFKELLTYEEQKKIIDDIQKDFGYKKAHCDKYDYMLASISGIISGFIDVFFVGSGKSGKKRGQSDERGQLSKSVSNGFNALVLKYAQFDYRTRNGLGIEVPNRQPNSIYDAVRYLEVQYKVPYDAQYGKRLKADLPNTFRMSADNHHLFSLAHYPDLVGLFFSILNQFNNTGTYLANGHLVTAAMQNNTFELQGHNFVAKIFCGFCNWLGHLMSDVVGSSGAVKDGHRGSGLPVPGTEVFQLLNFKIPKTDSLTISKLFTKVFEQGYDARHAAATAIPVVINELLTRLFWALKQYFYHKVPFKEIIKSRNIPELNRMLLCSYGTFAVIDVSDAAVHGLKTGVETGGNYQAVFIEIMSRLNITLYPRLALQGYKEVLSWYHNDHYNVEEFDNFLGSEWEKIAES